MPLPKGYTLDAPAPAQSGPKLPPGYTLDKPDSGHAPDWTDDVKASAKFLGNEIVGVGQAVNPYNIAKGAVNMIAHPIDTVKSLIDTPGRIYEQYQSGDMDGLAQSLGNVAGTIIAGKAAPEVPGAARGVAQRLGGTIDAAAPYASALAPVAAKGVLAAAKELPVVRSVMKSGGKLLDAYKEGKAAIDELNKPPAPKPVTTSSSIPTKVTPTSSTNVVNVAQSAGKGARTMDGMALDPETTQALVDAHKAGEVAKLPAEAKTQLTTAVKTGDSETVAKILDGHTAVKGVYQAVEDKVNVLVKYVQDHNIDLGQITPADRQTLADAAYAHGVKNKLTVPKGGKYRGVSDGTWKLVQDRLAGN